MSKMIMSKGLSDSNKHSVMIFLQGENYTKLKDLVEKRKISRFINELVAERLKKQEQEILQKKQQEREKFLKELAKAYQRTAQSKAMKTEAKIWEGAIEDGIDDEY